MKLEDALALAVPALYVVMLVVERLAPARQFPPIRRWALLGVIAFVVMAAFGVVMPMLLPVEWLARHRLIDGSGLGVAGGAIAGYAVLSLVSMAWHRFAHRVPFVWRWTHQMHHAPQRLDLFGAAYFHPLDMLAFNVVQALTLTLVIGLDPRAAAITGFIALFYSLFQHWNVRTPRWLGYIIQRPEAHCVHHELGVHAYNYSDLPLWDILFGTFKNPATFEGRVGFAEQASLGPLLLGRDVNASSASL
jgi:sterol desaturase/sphingolipid hydroxylase (fatty acid hydroxylase superfamily)